MTNQPNERVARSWPGAAAPDHAHAALRLTAGAMFALHGADKLFGVFGGFQPAVGSQLWIGGVIELVAGTAIALGAGARVAALLASGMMAVAYVQFHWRFALDARLNPLANGGELALLYAFVFLMVAARGAGRWSVDAWLAAPRRARVGWVGAPAGSADR